MSEVDPNKTVFISYRPLASRYIARTIFEHLRGHGYDVFLGEETLDSNWAAVVLNQIPARRHFLLLLTPGTLNRCSEPNDMLRREIEQAMKFGRNLVPLLVDEFQFGMAEAYLTGQLAALPQYDALRLAHYSFDETMDGLRDRFSKASTTLPVLHPTPSAEKPSVEQAISQAASEPLPTSAQLGAERMFTRAIGKQGTGDLEGAIADYTEAIRLNPNYANAYGNRGNVYFAKGDLEAALVDYNQVINLDPADALGYYNRGIARGYKGDLDGSIADYTEAIRLKPDYAEAYTNRGIARGYKGDLDGTIEDYNQVIRLKPEFASTYSNLGEVYFAQQHYDKALESFKKAADLRPGYTFAQAGLAITQHALGNVNEARRLWMGLMEQDKRYQDAEWVHGTLGWSAALLEVARKVIDELEM